MPSDKHFWTTDFAALRYGVVAFTSAWMRLVVLLPFRWQLALGKRFGRIAMHLLPGRRLVVEQNIRACFPGFSSAQRGDLVRRHFEALGASVAELAMGWYGPLRKIRPLVALEGTDHLAAALQRGRGVILLSAHFTSFELFFPVLAPLCPRLCGMYKSQRNPLMNRVMTEGRSRSFDHLFTKDSVRDMLRELASNSVVWYAADQSYGRKGSALLPFFDVPAMTNTAVSRIARASGAIVLPYFCRRLPDDSGYSATIGPALEDFPSDDALVDTARFTRLLEEYIMTCPEQYWWIHKRFKGRPADLPDIYRRRSD